MNGIIGMSELLTETELSTDQRVFADTIQKSAESLLVIINDILDFSKIEAGRMALDPAPFDLLSTAEDVLFLVWPKARSKSLDLALVWDPSLPRTLVGDQMRIRQVLINLVGNAVKFTLEGRVVMRVKGTVAREHVALSIAVEDSGVGIPEAGIKQIFAEFTRVDHGKDQHFEGTGLGLAITRKLTEAMGGSLKVTSQVNVGSAFTFQVVLPLAEPTTQPVLPTLSNMRVLCATSSAPAGEMVECWLGLAGAQVVVADTIPKALSTAELMAETSGPVDLVIVDERLCPANEVGNLARLAGGSENASNLIILGDADSSSRSLHAGVSNGRITLPLRPSALVHDVAQQFGSDLVKPGNQRAGGETAKPDEPPSTLPNLRILVAEDNRTNRMVVEKMLSDQSVEIHFAENGRIAVDAFRELKPDLVFMDMSMPEMDGIEATMLIRAHEADTNAPETPIIALTANAIEGDRERCIDAGMNDYLCKPIRKAQLLGAIDAHKPETLEEDTPHAAAG
ncbi:MAG: response regulator [Pseudomonadota bacterium]